MSESKEGQNHIRQGSFNNSHANYESVKFELVQGTSDIDRDADPQNLPSSFITISNDAEIVGDKAMNFQIKNMHVTQSVLEPTTGSNQLMGGDHLNIFY